MKSSFASCNTLVLVWARHKKTNKYWTKAEAMLKNGLNCLSQNYFRNYYWLIGSILKKKPLNQVLVPSDNLLGVCIFYSWTPVFKLKVHESHHRVFTAKVNTVKIFFTKAISSSTQRFEIKEN